MVGHAVWNSPDPECVFDDILVHDVSPLPDPFGSQSSHPSPGRPATTTATAVPLGGSPDPHVPRDEF